MVSLTMTRVCLAAMAMAGLALPIAAQAQSGSLVAQWGDQNRAEAALAQVLPREERDHYRQLFAAIDTEQWGVVESLIAQRPDGLLTQAALAEYYTHANSPKVSPEQIATWFNAGVDLPQAEQLATMGAKRGVAYLPALPAGQGFARQPYAPKRILPRTVNDGTMPAATASAILEAIKGDNPTEAQRLLAEADWQLSSDARAEWRQRVAWSHYIENNDAAALELARTVGEGSGEWVAEGAWVEGLAAWRLGYCSLAGEAFARTASRASNVELAAAGHYWAHRALVRCREPGQAQQHLSAAAQMHETLYGMLAADQLGVEVPAHTPPQPFGPDDWQQLAQRSNVRVAVALTEIGRPALADEVLRHEARYRPGLPVRSAVTAGARIGPALHPAVDGA